MVDFIDEVRTRSARFAKRIEHLDTEEATKTALVMPFIQMLGYSIFDPTEVVPEFTADFGSRKGEKVDYALMQYGQPIILIEAKKYGAALKVEQESQLFRYFSATNTRFGVLTDGFSYRFYSDLDAPKQMDNKPFFEFNMLDFTDIEVEQLMQFHKDSFNVDKTVEAARDLKYTNEVKRVLAVEMRDPCFDFVRFVLTRIDYPGSKTRKVVDQFTPLVQRAFTQFVNDRIDARLKSALAREERIEDDTDAGEDAVQAVTQATAHETGGIVTTAEELEGFEIVKSIVRESVNSVHVDRVFMRDTKSYFGIILDNNRRKPLCRLHFNSANNYLGVFDEEGKQEKHLLNSLDEIWNYGDHIRATLQRYLTAEQG